MIRRGEIWWATLPEPVGSEPGYRRPVLVACVWFCPCERMASKPRDEAIEVSFFGREDYFAYYYAYAKASGKLLHARRTPHP